MAKNSRLFDRGGFYDVHVHVPSYAMELRCFGSVT